MKGNRRISTSNSPLGQFCLPSGYLKMSKDNFGCCLWGRCGCHWHLWGGWKLTHILESTAQAPMVKHCVVPNISSAVLEKSGCESLQMFPWWLRFRASLTKVYLHPFLFFFPVLSISFSKWGYLFVKTERKKSSTFSVPPYVKSVFIALGKKHLSFTPVLFH